MAKFEYRTMTYDPKGIWGGKVDTQDFQERLNDLGAQGWELVSSVATAQSYGVTKSVVSIFKRKIRSEFKDGQ